LTAAFDTLKFAQTLREKAKLSPEQAEGISQAFAEASGDQLATKTDVVALRSDLSNMATKNELHETELRLEAKIEATKSEILKWIFGQTLLIIGAVIALTRLGH